MLHVVDGCKTWSVVIRGKNMCWGCSITWYWATDWPERVEVIGEWRRLHKEEFHDLYCSPDIIRAIEWRRMRGAGHAARVERQKVLEIKSYSSSRLSCAVSSFYCLCAAGRRLVKLEHVARSYWHVRLDGCGSRFIVVVLTPQRHDHDPPQQGVCTPSNHCALEGCDYQFFCNYVTSYTDLHIN